MGDKKEKRFISERILGRELTFPRAVKYLLLSLLCGALFGAAFFGVSYMAEKKLNRAETREPGKTEPETEPSAAETEPEEDTRESVPETETPVPETESRTAETEKGGETETETPEADEAGTETGGREETEAQTGEGSKEENEAGNGTATETETPEEVRLTQKQLEQVKEYLAREQKPEEPGTEELVRLLGTQEEICGRIGEYVVKVSCIISEVTWFESTVETERIWSGVIAGVTGDEVLVLTVKQAVVEGGRYQVTFFDGTKQNAVVKQVAELDGWSVFAVDRQTLGTEFAEGLKAAELMPSAKVQPGIPVITAGSPMGVPSSYGFGYLNYLGGTESIMDGSILCCSTEAASDPAAGTFLMSEAGELIGLAVKADENSEVRGNRFIVAASCSPMIESLKKGYDQAKLGITGMDISFDMKYRKIPEGLYVTDVEEGSPAFQAGLKRGDIIVMIGSREIRGLADYCGFMRNLRPEETVKMTVMRESTRSEYKELELSLTATVR